MNLLKDDQLQFFPGIFQKSDIKEDEVVFSDEYSLKLGSVRANAKGGSLLGQKLLKHYDWTKLENLILKHLDTTGDGHLHRIDDFGEDIMWKIDDWLHSFDGWGLAFLLVDTDNEEDREGLQSFILHMYEHILEDSENNVVDPEDAYKSLFAHWFPVLEEEMEFIYVNECMFLKGPKEGNNWTQTLRIIFSTFADERIIVDIFIEKLKSSKLLDLAAGVVAANIDEERAEDVESLIIPKTLKLLVRKKILDLKWARFQVKDGHELEYEDILQSTMPEFLFLW